MRDKVIIQNKRTGKREVLTAEQYQRLKDVGFHGGWTIIKWIDENDAAPVPKKLPQDIVDFSQIQTKKKKPKTK